MPSVLRSLCALVCVFSLAGCEIWGDDADVTEDPTVIASQSKVPVQSVGKVEVGRTRDGFLITAFGTAPGLGYAKPELRVRRSGRPANDGFLEFDFIATRPTATDLPPGTTRARAIRADRLVSVRDLRGIAGIRVLALNGGVQVAISGGG